MASGRKTILKVEPVLGGFDSANYKTEYLHATASDGSLIPISIAYRKGTKLDGTAPLYQYAYGSYGLSTDPAFIPNWVSLMDRGFVVAIAHVRGGQEMGRAWYEQGQAAQQEKHLHGFHSGNQASGAREVRRARQSVRAGWQRRRSADGCGSEPCAKGLSRHHRQRAIRRHSNYHAGRIDSADHQRIRRMGQSERQDLLRLHAVLFALRQRKAQVLPRDAGDERPMGLASTILGGCQVGSKAPRKEDRQQPTAVQGQYGSRPRRQVRPLRKAARNSNRVSVHPEQP